MFWWQYSYETGTTLSCKYRTTSGVKDYTGGLLASREVMPTAEIEPNVGS